MFSLGINVNERQLVSARHATAQPSRVSGGCKVLLYSRRPSSAQVSFVGGFGFGIADVQDVEEVLLELDVLLVMQLIGNVVNVVVLVLFVITLL